MGIGITGLLQGIGGAGSDEELYGRKPIIPDFPDLPAAQKEAIAANQKSLPAIKRLAGDVNRFNQEELLAMLEETLPGGADQIQENISAELRGEIPKDVQEFIQRNAAERAVDGGYGGSGVHRNLEARDLGLTSLDLTKRGLDSATRWMSFAKAPQYDPTSMFLSPAEQYAAKVGKFQRDLHAANIAAAPDPQKRGAWDTEMGFLGMVLSAYAGGAGYTQTNRPQELNNQGYAIGGSAAPAQNRYVPNNYVAPQAAPEYTFNIESGTADTGARKKTFGFF